MFACSSGLLLNGCTRALEVVISESDEVTQMSFLYVRYASFSRDVSSASSYARPLRSTV
jgi:hypothetical protein